MNYFVYLFALFFSLSLLSVNAENLKDKNFGNVTISEVTSISDGDTFRANIVGWPKIISNRIGVRINGIDTPELRGKCQAEKEKAKFAKQFAVEKLRKAKKIELRNMKRGKYFRIIADVWVDDKNLAEALLKAGHAVKYDGSTKTNDWCKKSSSTDLESSKKSQKTVKSRDSKFSCVKKNCKNMSSCEEAYYQLKTCGYGRLDRDNDGVPCEIVCSSD